MEYSTRLTRAQIGTGKRKEQISHHRLKPVTDKLMHEPTNVLQILKSVGAGTPRLYLMWDGRL